jgi:hypothetical protein
MPVVTDPLDEIRAIMIRYSLGQIGSSGADQEVTDILRRKGLVSQKVIKPMLAGIHHLNRGGIMGASQGVRKLTDKIAGLHSNWGECSHAKCIELTGLDRTDEEHFRKWCEEAGVEPASGGTTSIEQCPDTHMHQRFSRLFLELEQRRFTEKHGKHDAAYAQAVEEGLNWTVVPAHVW